MPRTWILVLCLFLAACAQKVTTLKVDQDKPLEANMGYLLVSVDTTQQLQWIKISGEKSLLLTSDDLRKGSNYILVDVPAGKYSLDEVRLSKYLGMQLNDEAWNFVVEPATINYIGHLNIDAFIFMGMFGKATAVLENRSTDALIFMKKSFTNIFSSRLLKYAGPGEDGFLDYVTQLPKGVSK